MDKADAIPLGGVGMTFAESIPIARQLAEKELTKGFDVEAFLILAELSRMDAVPESNVDEGISDIGKIFIEYFYNQSTENLVKLADRLIQTVSEVYQTIGNADDKRLFREKLQILNDIIV